MDKKTFWICAAIVLAGFSVSCCGLCVLGQVRYHRQPVVPGPWELDPEASLRTPEACIAAFGRPTSDRTFRRPADAFVRSMTYEKARAVVVFTAGREGDPWGFSHVDDMDTVFVVAKRDAVDRLYRHR